MPPNKSCENSLTLDYLISKPGSFDSGAVRFATDASAQDDRVVAVIRFIRKSRAPVSSANNSLHTPEPHAPDRAVDH